MKTILSLSVSSTPPTPHPVSSSSLHLRPHPHLSDHFNARGLSLMHKRSRGGLLPDIVESVVLCHHGYPALTHAHQSNGLYVSLSPCDFSGTNQFGGGTQGQDKKKKIKKKGREFVTFTSLGNGLVFQINYSLLFIVVETLFAPKCFKTGLMMVKWNNSFLSPNKSFFSSRAAFYSADYCRALGRSDREMFWIWRHQADTEKS